ncbi:MAG: hypothetical protein JXB39_01290 [Deltaproteobacteria bacterium]|nr:hypothetical protein [Deltaproteobacteria bacterium]
MNAFPWAHRAAPDRIVHLPEDCPLYVVSDVHLGDGSRSDAFVAKDREFLAFLEEVRREGIHLVIAGDIVDFPQAITFTRVLKAHGPVFHALSQMAQEAGVTYIWGNHDIDISLYRDLLRWDVCSAVEVGDRLRVEHGHRYDPHIAGNEWQAAWTTLLHHLLERVLGTWIRTPLAEFYTLANRWLWWAAGRWTQVVGPVHHGLETLGLPGPGERYRAFLRYWLRTQVGDPMCIFSGVREQALAHGPGILLTGHSHLPGVVEIAPGVQVANSGSWTFRSATVARWDGRGVEVRDRLTGRVWDDILYRPLVEGRLDDLTFERWWTEEYMGWIRFRSGEARRRRLAWEPPWLLPPPTDPTPPEERP